MLTEYKNGKQLSINEFYKKETLVVRAQDDSGIPIVCRFLTTNNYVLESVGEDARLAYTLLFKEFKEQKIVLPENQTDSKFRRFSLNEIIHLTEPQGEMDTYN